MSDRDYDGEGVSAWTLLSNATDDDTQTVDEFIALGEFHKVMMQYKSAQEEISEVRELIRFVSMHHANEAERINKLKKQERSISVRINSLDSRLRELQSSQPLQDVLARKEAEAFARAKQKSQEVLAAYRAEAEAHQQEVIKQWEAKRKEALKQMQEKQQKEDREEARENSIDKNNRDYIRRMLFLLLPMVLSITLPLIMLDAPIWLMTIIDLIILSPLLFNSISLAILMPYAYYIIKPILYIWALVVTILGVQDFVSVAFYIIMGVQFPKMAINFIGTLMLLYKAHT